MCSIAYRPATWSLYAIDMYNIAVMEWAWTIQEKINDRGHRMLFARIRRETNLFSSSFSLLFIFLLVLAAFGMLAKMCMASSPCQWTLWWFSLNMAHYNWFYKQQQMFVCHLTAFMCGCEWKVEDICLLFNFVAVVVAIVVDAVSLIWIVIYIQPYRIYTQCRQCVYKEIPFKCVLVIT